MPDANTVAIGAWGNDDNGSNSGHVRIYQKSGSTWVQKGSDIDGEAADDQFSTSVSMPNSNTVAIGARRNDGNGSNSGHVRVFEWNGSSWVQKGNDIDGESADDGSGFSVSMPDINTVAIGANNNDGNGTDAGHVRIFTWNGTNWIQKGNDIDGEAAFDGSGYSIDMPDTNTIAIGAPLNADNGSRSGHVRIYEWSNTAWVQKGMDIDGEAPNDESGSSVNMPDANTVAIGAERNNGAATRAGHVRVYRWSGTIWIQKGVDIDGEAAEDRSGSSVSMPDSNTVAIGADGNDGNGSSSGHVRIYEWINGGWVQKGMDIDGEASFNYSGEAVCMPDVNTVAIGAGDNSNSNGLDAGHVRVFNYGSVSTGPQLERAAEGLKLYPNPARNNVTIELSPNGNNQPLLIYDLQGKLIHKQSLLQKQEQIDTENWKAGIYFVRFGKEMQKLVILE